MEEDFIELVAKMRESQKEYFRGRMGRDLEKAKKLESEVDKRIKAYREKQLDLLQPKLF